jgi:two-component system, cell cycle sensor histidine kinase and response regulator CckA
MSGSHGNSRAIAYLSVSLAFLVALLFPVGYYAISHHHAMGSLEAEAEINASVVTGVINANPDLWQFEHLRLEELLSRRPQSGQAETRRIFDAKGAEVASSGGNLQPPILSRTQQLLDAGHVVGSIEISRSLRPILEHTAIMGLIGLGLGLVVFILLPFRAISQAELQLRDSYSFLTRVMESSTNAIMVLNLTGCIEMANEHCADLCGTSRAALYGQSAATFFEDCSVAKILGELERVASGAVKNVRFETELRRPDGTTVPVSCGAASILQEGHVASTVFTLEDIRERKLAAEQLKQAKEYTENLLQAASVIIVGLDSTGVVTLMNRTAQEVTGYSAAELTGRNWYQSVTSAEQPREEPGAAAGPRGTRETTESQVVTKSGELRTISWRNSPIIEEGRRIGTLCFGIDVTDHKMVEAQLRQSQKMESIGQLAGGVAHDFNNMLSVILGYAQLCQMEVTQESQLWQYVQEISKAGERSRDMVRQLLAFSRKEIISPRPINLNAHVIATEKTLGRLIGEEITLSFLPATNLWTVKIDPSQVDQILMNLAVNARDAMPGGGRLTLETANVTIDAAFCLYRLDARPGDYSCLTVRDTGTGMDRELVKRIFEPFFTTKEIGRGTGLGLATVYGIVTQNNGFIEVKSEPGRGTDFLIYLPRMIEESEAVAPEEAQTLTGSGTVLVVEDDGMLLSMAAQMLEKIGYRVIRAESPRMALAVCQDDAVAIDLVLSDVVMPGMNGRELAQEIALLRPALKVLFMSGYSSEIVARRGIMELGMNFIQKPFDMEGLNLKIRETLA